MNATNFLPEGFERIDACCSYAWPRGPPVYDDRSPGTSDLLVLRRVALPSVRTIAERFSEAAKASPGASTNPGSLEYLVARHLHSQAGDVGSTGIGRLHSLSALIPCDYRQFFADAPYLRVYQYSLPRSALAGICELPLAHRHDAVAAILRSLREGAYAHDQKDHNPSGWITDIPACAGLAGSNAHPPIVRSTRTGDSVVLAEEDLNTIQSVTRWLYDSPDSRGFIDRLPDESRLVLDGMLINAIKLYHAMLPEIGSIQTNAIPLAARPFA